MITSDKSMCCRFILASTNLISARTDDISLPLAFLGSQPIINYFPPKDQDFMRNRNTPVAFPDRSATLIRR